MYVVTWYVVTWYVVTWYVVTWYVVTWLFWRDRNKELYEELTLTPRSLTAEAWHD